MRSLNLYFLPWGQNRRNAKIVADAQSCYGPWYKGLNWQVGIELQELIKRLRLFVNAFKELGIQLVFFYGGLTPEKKREAWIQRRRNNHNDIHILIDVLKHGGNDDNEDFLKMYDSIPPNMGLASSYILKYILNCQVSI